MLKNESTRRRKTISAKWCWRKIRALRSNSNSTGLQNHLRNPTEFGPQKYNIFVLVFLLPPPVSAADFGDIWVSLKPGNTASKCQAQVTVPGMTSWHSWDQILSVWLGKSLWVTSRGGSCVQLPDPPTRQDPRSSNIRARAGNTFWQTELSSCF